MVEQTLHSISQFYPELIIVLTLCVIIIADLLVKKESHVSGWILIGGMLLAGMATIYQYGGSESIFYDMIAVDPFALFFKLLLLLTGIFIVLFTMNNGDIRGYESRLGEYYMLLSGMLLGMMLMVGSSNILLMYLALELTSMSSYVLVGFTKNSLRSSEASVKYLVYGAVASGIMLYGFSLLIGMTGSANIYAINGALSVGITQPMIMNISILMILVGLGFKIAVVPFHFWAPDAYEGAPITISATLAVASKIAAFAMVIRFFSVTFIGGAGLGDSGVWQLVEGVHWNIVLGILAAFAMIVGNLTALYQDNIKRMLAYSSIAHAGYILMGAVILSEQGIASVLIYLAVYLFMTLGAFYVAMLFSNQFHTESIEGYKGLGHRAPLMGVAMTIFLVSLTGIPPTGGFVAKLYIFGAAVSGGWIWLALIAGVTTVVSLFYYIRVVRNMFFFKPTEEVTPFSFGMSAKVILLLLLIPTVLLGVYFTPLIELAQHSMNILGLN
jgi:NADH-quinone oxidoreductase subunit N